MCGRYVLALRPSQIRRMLQDDDMLIDEAPPDDGPLAPRQSYNFAPAYHGIVLRAADAPQESTSHASPSTDNSTPSTNTTNTGTPPNPAATTPQQQPQHYILQTMKWGLIPAWTAKSPNPDAKQPYTTTLKTINCRADSLALPTGLWARLRHRRRCIVPADGFYEWLQTGPKHRVPYYIKRRDGAPLFLAGLWDYVPPAAKGEEGVYSYTIITTEACAALRFLHDRMPVVMEPGGEAMRAWLGGEGWGKRMQELLRPWEVEGGLEIYKVSGDVGKVGRSERRFVEPVEGRGNKGNIANWFERKGEGSVEGKGEGAKGKDVEVEVKGEDGEVKTEMKSVDEVEEDAGMPVTPVKGVKREAEGETKEEPPAKKMMDWASPSPVKPRPKISATSNARKSPKKVVKGKGDGSQKITKFFGNSA